MPSNTIRIQVCNDASSGFVSAQVAPDHGARAVDGGVARTVQCCRACSADSASVWHGRAASPMHDRQRDHGIRGGDWRRVWRRPINAGDRWQGRMKSGWTGGTANVHSRSGRGVTACLPCEVPLLAAQPQATTPKDCPSRSWLRPSWPAVGRRLPSRRQKPPGPLSSTSRPRPMDATHTHMRLAGAAEDMSAKDGREMGEDCVDHARPLAVTPGLCQLSLPGLLGERGGENIQPPSPMSSS